ncbi:MAG: 3-deoxy-manno-octulosonate cytidylyltransferase [bacterium]|nr:3-deoxy-manno-octulosonate cytidylyltransferase [bacterium]
MKAIVIIPARYASTRLRGKPLLDQTGMPLIQHVVQSVSSASSIDKIVVATDDDRIATAVEAFGGNCVMTRSDHISGTDRLAEAAEKLGLEDDDIVVNVQGDEPEMPCECVDQLVELLSDGNCPMATLGTPLSDDEVDDPNKVKLVLRTDGRALYFSRSRIPHDRDSSRQVRYLLHLGIYAYRVAFLKQYANLAPSPAEQAEKLEQLRVLESGFVMIVGAPGYHDSGIDTPEDYEAVVNRFAG